MNNEEAPRRDEPAGQPYSSRAISERPLRRRWLVFSFLIGISLAAGVAAIILLLGGLVDALRSPVLVNAGVWGVWAVMMTMVALPVLWLMRPSRRLNGHSFWGVAVTLVIASLPGYLLVGSVTSSVNESGAAFRCSGHPGVLDACR